MQTIDFLPLVKADPALSRTYGEVSCIAGVRMDGDTAPEWIRLYPVPFRALEHERQFAKYQPIRLEVAPHRGDRRPETRRPNRDSIERLGDTLEHEAGAGGSETDIGEQEQRGAGGEDVGGADAVTGAPSGNADERRGQVVRGVQDQRELCGGRAAGHMLGAQWERVADAIGPLATPILSFALVAIVGVVGCQALHRRRG